MYSLDSTNVSQRVKHQKRPLTKQTTGVIGFKDIDDVATYFWIIQSPDSSNQLQSLDTRRHE
jgi:hypothetical protein